MTEPNESTEHTEFTVPEDFSGLRNEQLDELLTTARAEFGTLRAQTSITDGDLERMRSLAAGVQRIQVEQETRVSAAREAAAEIDSLAAQVNGEEANAPEDDGASGGEEEAAEVTAAAPDDASTAAGEGDARPESATAAAAPSRTYDLSMVRQRQPRVLPPERTVAIPRITAAVDVPGYRAGDDMTLQDLVPGTIRRASSIVKSGHKSGLVASYHHPFPEELVVNDPGSAPEGSTVALHAAQQARLPKGDLVASGGWCAPSETLYTFLEVSCPDMLWDAPEIQLARGGLRYFKTPSLDVAAMTWVHTEADDIAGNEKPCYKIPCEEPIESRCDAVGICVEAGILTQRHFPELVSFYLNLTMVAHEIRVRQHLLAQVAASATPVVMPTTFGALSAVFDAVALQAADMIERHSLCDNIALEVVFPWWSRNLFLADLARRNGVRVDEVTVADVQALFTPLGVRIQWARGIGPAVPGDIGGQTPVTAWPTEIEFLIYPAGQIQIGRGAEVSLGVVHSPELFRTNDYTAAFSEECVTIIDRSVDTRLVTVPVCPSGETGAQTLLTCAAS
ncbi:major capsid protein [Streptomyces sp. NRRL B-1347]|uniref:major capsid protein n=1 Tax=Streptomyces sp. NRRL B-1347 TaxID=1476877 RepID=UPI0004C8033E|nr:major capsid protein [Streptomyces sp. NRRL B-1347]